MEKIALLLIILTIVTTAILALFTYKQFRNETSEKMWKLWAGNTTYWSLLSLVGMGISTGIMGLMRFVEII